jgi:uncharacterized MAPEG superfamily protein
MTPIHALLGFTAWTLLLVFLVFVYRSFRFLTGTPVNSWPRGARAAHDPAWVQRAADAHANGLENLPIFAVIVLAAAALDKTALVAPLAPWVLYARVGQSVAHLLGTSQPLVLVRATFWAAQLALFFWMLARLVA